MKKIIFIKNKKGKMYYKMLMMFLLFTSLLLISTASIIYGITSNLIYKKIDKIQEQQNLNGARMIEFAMKKIDEMAISIINEPVLKFNIGELDTEQKMHFGDYVFNKYYSDNVVDSMYLYYKDENKVISSNSNITDIQYLEDNGWLEYAEKCYENYKFNDIIYRNFEGKEFITKLYTFPFKASKKIGVMVVNIDKSKLFESFAEKKDEFSIIIDKNDNYAYGNKEIYSSMIGKSGEFKEVLKNFEYNGKKYIISAVKADDNTFMYIRGTDKKSLYFEIATFRNIIFLVCVIILIIIFFCYKKYAYNLSTPLEKLAEKISKESGVKNNGHSVFEKDEISTIDAALERIIEKKQSIEAFYQNSRNSILQNVLLGLCSSAVEDEKFVMDSLGMIGFPMVGRYYTAIVVQVDIGDDSEQKIFREFIIDSKYKDADVITVYMNKNRIAVLVNTGTKDVSIMTIAKTIQHTLMDEHNIECSIGIGNTYDNLIMYNTSFKEALDALVYQSAFPGGNISHINDYIAMGESGMVYMPLENEEKFIEAVKLANLEMAIDIYNKIYLEIKIIDAKNQYLSMQIWQIMNNVVKILLKLGYDYEDVFEESLVKDFSKFNDLLSVNEMHDFVEEKIITAVKYISNKRNFSNDRIVKTIKEYIDIHYMEEVTLDTFAAMMSLSNNYISTLFKASTGDEIRKYITNVRMEKAVELLKKKRMNVGDIAEAIGYENTRTFFRNFKAKFGVTPTEYRKGRI